MVLIVDWLVRCLELDYLKHLATSLRVVAFVVLEVHSSFSLNSIVIRLLIMLYSFQIDTELVSKLELLLARWLALLVGLLKEDLRVVECIHLVGWCFVVYQHLDPLLNVRTVGFH